jgi:hypothetical protein
MPQAGYATVAEMSSEDAQESLVASPLLISVMELATRLSCASSVLAKAYLAELHSPEYGLPISHILNKDWIPSTT